VAVALAVLTLLRAASAADIRIENDLPACVAIHLDRLRPYENLIVANAAFEMWKAVGNCGCKSAEIGYSVYALVDGHENFVIAGKVGAMQSRQALLVLSPDRRDDDPRRDIKLELSCARPD
jgi:hypothetical protein